MFKMMKKVNRESTSYLKEALMHQKDNPAPTNKSQMSAVQEALINSCMSAETRNWMQKVHFDVFNCDMDVCLEKDPKKTAAALADFERCQSALDSLQDELNKFKENNDVLFTKRYAHVVLPTDDYIRDKLKDADVSMLNINDANLLWQALACACISIASMLTMIDIQYDLYLSGGASV